jgi:hypothetical protein
VGLHPGLDGGVVRAGSDEGAELGGVNAAGGEETAIHGAVEGEVARSTGKGGAAFIEGAGAVGEAGEGRFGIARLFLAEVFRELADCFEVFRGHSEEGFVWG